ncbi:hypothetical protein EAF04_007907 [Stromatinia cepivora]|nr:hypothetical protein EAF04_007907 [Stromatinia cepivora]
MSTSQPQTPPPSFAPGNTALITGGASGIGLSLAEKCIKYGMNVILVDNNGDDLGKAQMYLSKMSKGDQQVVGLMVDVGGGRWWRGILRENCTSSLSMPAPHNAAPSAPPPRTPTSAKS